MENKKIKNLAVHMTKKALSLLGVMTIITTGLSGCKKEVENNSSSDISMTSSVTSEDELIESEIEEIIDSSISEDSEISNENSKDNNKVNSNNSSKLNSSTGSTVSSSNNPSSGNNNHNNYSSQVSSPTNSSQNTSSVTSTPSVKPPMPSKLTKDNINDIEVFKYFALQFNKELHPNGLFTTYNYTYNGKNVRSIGTHEFEIMLALLNYEYMSSDTLDKLFGDLTLEEFKQCSYFLDYMAGYLSPIEVIYDMTKYSINKDIGRFLNEFQTETKTVYNNVYTDKMDQLLTLYFNNNNSIIRYGNTNYFVDFFITTMSAQITYKIEYELKEKVINAQNDCSYSYLDNMTDLYYNFKGKSKKIN